MSTTQALTVVTPQYEDAELLKTIKETVCKGATEPQFRMFIEVCRATGLNPFLKEIWFVPGVGVMAARDGYLRVANQHPQFDGMETRVERDERNVPIKAVCTVWRKDRNHPVICEAYYSEYKKGGNVWSTYPSAMIAKVAEVLALKRSFAINGVVTEEEIGERGSKEAQDEYLRSKGIERNKNVRPAVKEWANIEPAQDSGIDAAMAGSRPAVSGTEGGDARANMVSQPPNVKSPDDTIEQRETAKRAEAEEVLNQAASEPKPAKRKKGGVSFKALQAIGEVKELLRKDSGDDAAYYSILKSFGYEKSNEIKDDDEARSIYKALAMRHKQITSEKDLLDTLTHAGEVIGVRALTDILGVHGCETMAQTLSLEGDPLAALLAEVKARVDERKGF